MVSVSLVGKRFGKLVVLEREWDFINPMGKRYPKYLCKCDCGNQCQVIGSMLKQDMVRCCKDCD